MRDHHPDEWADAVQVDHAIRKGAAKDRDGTHIPLNGEAYLHRPLVPLDEADLRSPSQRMRDAGQQALFDLDEDGDPDGCSPYGCRSGLEAT